MCFNVTATEQVPAPETEAARTSASSFCAESREPSSMPPADTSDAEVHSEGSEGTMPSELEELPKEQPELPSVGSAQHNLGCQPCAWFWKPQGCLNGAACLRCHLCPAGEIKRRKGELKQKKAAALEGDAHADALAGGPTVPPPPTAPNLNLCDDGLPPAPSWTAADPTLPSALPSVGSRLHGTGQCKPCAWFWKAEGCRNEAACGHCHLCPVGEAKARKQAKLAAIRAKQGGDGPTDLHEPGCRPGVSLEGVAPVIMSNISTAPALLFHVAEMSPGHLQQVQFVQQVQQVQQAQQVPVPPIQQFQPLQSFPLHAPAQPTQPAQAPLQSIQQVQIQPVPCQPTWTTIPSPPSQSQPGPQPGPQPPFLPQLSQPQRPVQRPVLLGHSLPAFQPAQSIGKLGSAYNAEGCSSFVLEAGERRYVPPVPETASSLSGLSSVPSHAPQFPHVTPLSLPSVGSALHADGKCSPCAWFWKPQGCRHGVHCGRCHLCPAGEIKQRKKSKAAAKEVTSAEPDMNFNPPLILD